MFKLGLGCIVIAAVACGGSKAKTSPPANTPPPQDPLRADVELFCSAEAATHATGWPELGPFLEPKLHDTALRKAMFGLRDGSVSMDEFHVRVLALTAQQHIDPCPTLDKLYAPKTP